MLRKYIFRPVASQGKYTCSEIVQVILLEHGNQTVQIKKSLSPIQVDQFKLVVTCSTEYVPIWAFPHLSFCPVLFFRSCSSVFQCQVISVLV